MAMDTRKDQVMLSGALRAALRPECRRVIKSGAELGGHCPLARVPEGVQVRHHHGTSNAERADLQRGDPEQPGGRPLKPVTMTPLIE